MGVDQRNVLTNIAMAQVRGVLVTCLAAGETTDDEVRQMLARFDQKDYRGLLFVARGAGPNSKQRALIADYWKRAPGGKPPRTVVLTDSVAARFVTQALSWLMNTETKSYAERDVEMALAYLGCPEALADVSGTIAGLHAAIDFKQRRAG